MSISETTEAFVLVLSRLLLKNKKILVNFDHVPKLAVKYYTCELTTNLKFKKTGRQSNEFLEILEKSKFITSDLAAA